MNAKFISNSRERFASCVVYLSVLRDRQKPFFVWMHSIHSYRICYLIYNSRAVCACSSNRDIYFHNCVFTSLIVVLFIAFSHTHSHAYTVNKCAHILFPMPFACISSFFSSLYCTHQTEADVNNNE